MLSSEFMSSPAPLRLDNWRAELALRPFLFISACAVAGVALGGQWALFLGDGDLAILTRDDARLSLPLLIFALFAVVGGLIWRKFALVWACLIVGVFTFYTAWRLAPPPNDISRLISQSAPRDLPLTSQQIRLRGIVADFPRRGDFNVQFPLQTENGRIWVRAPFDDQIRAGDTIELSGELRPLSRATNLGERETMWFSIGANCWCELRKVGTMRVVKNAPQNSLIGRVDTLRRLILGRYETLFRAKGLENRPFPSATAQLLTALVFGESGLSQPLPRAVRDDFRVAGLSHILVASGAQVSFIAVILLLAARALRLRGIWLFALLIPLLGAYAMVSGGAPSILRATAVGLLVALALSCGRRTDALSLWSAALFGFLASDPALAWSLSLQLTFGATWGLIVLSPAIMRLLRRANDGPVLRPVLALAALSLGAQWATLPLLLFHFERFSVASLGANFLAVPLASAMVSLGALGLIFPFLEPLLYGLTRAMAGVAHGAARLPGAGVQGISLPLSWTLCCYVLLACAALAAFTEPRDWVTWRAAHIKRFKVRWNLWRGEWRSLALVAAVILVAFFVWRFWPPRDEVRFVMLDVGQGESLILVSPRGRAVLIDGGTLDEREDVGRSVILPALQQMGISRLEAVFLTHADADHCSALESVFREIPVGVFVDGALASRSEFASDDPTQTAYLATRRAAQRAGIPTIAPRADQLWNFDGLQLRVLAPTKPLLESENDNALVLRAEYGQISLLLTGDIETRGEERLVARDLQNATVLKVSHHGAGGSSSEEFLRAVQPQLALISCGRYNRFQHPRAETLKRLQDVGANVFRTDLDGALDVRCSRENCVVQTTK